MSVIRAGLEFSFSRPTIDPIFFDDLEGKDGRYERFQRIMAGEHGRPSCSLIEWDDASHRQRNLAALLDELLDDRRWFSAQVLPGLYEAISHDAIDLERNVVLVVATKVDGWSPDRTPTKCHIDLITRPDVVEDNSARAEFIGSMLANPPTYVTYKTVEAFAIETEIPTIESIGGEVEIHTETPAAV